jgi:hypothetical protein
MNMFFKKATKPEVVVSFCIFVWIFIVNVAALALNIVSWPLFFVTIFYFILGNDKKNIPSIFCGGVLGLVLALLLALGLNGLAPAIGVLPAFAILIFIELGLIIMGGTICPLFCNNIAFAYLTAATIVFGNVNPISILNNLLVLIIGGAIILGGSLLAFNIGVKLVTPKAQK